MKPEEAIEDIRKCIQPSVGGKSLQMAIEALEKQVAKKVDISPYNIKFCPVCKGSVWQNKDESKYCFRCGQKIYWGNR